MKSRNNLIQTQQGKTCEAVRAGLKNINMNILKFVTKIYRALVSIILWILLIFGVLLGVGMISENVIIGILIIIGTPVVIALIAGNFAIGLRNSENLERMANKLDPK